MLLHSVQSPCNHSSSSSGLHEVMRCRHHPQNRGAVNALIALCTLSVLLQIPLGLVILLDPYYNRNAIWARDDFSTLVMAISAGYFLYDTLECMCRLEHEGWDFLLHGFFCLMVYSFLTHTGYLHYYGGWAGWRV
jgi:hypothetical protein